MTPSASTWVAHTRDPEPDVVVPEEKDVIDDNGKRTESVDAVIEDEAIDTDDQQAEAVRTVESEPPDTNDEPDTETS